MICSQSCLFQHDVIMEMLDCVGVCGHISCRVLCLGILTESSNRLLRTRHNGRWCSHRPDLQKTVRGEGLAVMYGCEWYCSYYGSVKMPCSCVNCDMCSYTYRRELSASHWGQERALCQSLRTGESSLPVTKDRREFSASHWGQERALCQSLRTGESSLPVTEDRREFSASH